MHLCPLVKIATPLYQFVVKGEIAQIESTAPLVAECTKGYQEDRITASTDNLAHVSIPAFLRTQYAY
jgi:hypothetical protein